mmetsp:Transcript_37669/g.98700  ORF Transcript_37669/g.98700 Transcript_37669/m.98700 type:complete len:218 (+) Transcript_37669:288-941(+)
MSVMSRPRDATSVATSVRTAPRRNFWSVRSRSHCSMSPWSASQFQPSPLSSLASSSHRLLVPQKTMALACSLSAKPSLSVLTSTIKWCILSFFSDRGITRMICVTLALATRRLPTSPMCTVTGSTRNSDASARIFFGHVAVNKSIWYPGGTLPRALRMSGSKPISSMRSASSSVTYDTLSSLTCPKSAMSRRRPGVAMRMSQPSRHARMWSPRGTPP